MSSRRVLTAMEVRERLQAIAEAGHFFGQIQVLQKLFDTRDLVALPELAKALYPEMEKEEKKAQANFRTFRGRFNEKAKLFGIELQVDQDKVPASRKMACFVVSDPKAEAIENTVKQAASQSGIAMGGDNKKGPYAADNYITTLVVDNEKLASQKGLAAENWVKAAR